MKSVADQVRNEIESTIHQFTPDVWDNEHIRWYLVGVVNGACWFGKLDYFDAKAIKDEYIPQAVEWFAMRREVEERRLQR